MIRINHTTDYNNYNELLNGEYKNQELIKIVKYKESRTRCDSFFILYTLILHSFLYTNSAGDPQD